MSQARAAASCSVLPVEDHCQECEGNWIRVPRKTFTLSEPICGHCGSRPRKLRIRTIVNYVAYEFRYDRKGMPIKTVDDAIRVSTQVREALATGTFNRSHYRKGMIFLTLAEYIHDQFMPKQRLTMEEKIMLEDYMAPHFSEVGVFVACQIHLYDFIRTYGLRGEKRELAERLFSSIVSEIKL